MSLEELEEIALANRVSSYKTRAINAYKSAVNMAKGDSESLKGFVALADFQNKKNISSSHREKIINASPGNVEKVAMQVLEEVILETNPQAFAKLTPDVNTYSLSEPTASTLQTTTPGIQYPQGALNMDNMPITAQPVSKKNNNNTIIIAIIIAVIVFVYFKNKS